MILILQIAAGVLIGQLTWAVLTAAINTGLQARQIKALKTLEAVISQAKETAETRETEAKPEATVETRSYL